MFFYINKYSKSANRLSHNAMCLQIICTFSLYTQRKKEKMLSCKDIATLKNNTYLQLNKSNIVEPLSNISILTWLPMHAM